MSRTSSVQDMRYTVTLPLFTLALAACAVGTDDADEAEPSLVAAVDRPSGNRVEFHATDDGEVLLSETGPAGNLPSLSRDVAMTIDPRDYYRALAAAEPPVELANLVELGETRYRRMAPAEIKLTDGPRQLSPWFSADNFENRACDKYYDADKQWCDLDRRYDSKHRTDDVNGVYSIILVDQGSVELKRNIRPHGTWQRSTWTVRAGEWRWWWHSAGPDFDAESAIEDASGDWYHHAGMMCWDWGGACPVYRAPGFDDD
jgi:hypothetical protein